jgi:metallo-beta-lactamase class B
MRMISACGAALVLASCAMDDDAAAGARGARLASDAVIDAATKAAPLSWVAENGWNDPMAPFTVIGNIHYVGTRTISAWLITDPQGHVLIDGVVPQSAPQIIGNIKALGFDIKDVKYLLNSHAHMDHAGGLAALQRASGAVMAASAGDKPYLEAGMVDHGPTKGVAFPPIRVDRVVGEGDVVRVGAVTLTAHMTPGHSPGCTSWSMPVKGADGAAHRAFFHCSATVAGQSLVPEAYPGMVAATFAKLREQQFDVLLGNHDSFFDLHTKLARLKAGDANAFVDADEFGRFNSQLEADFYETLAAEQKAAKP